MASYATRTVVLTSRQLLAATVAVALCSEAAIGCLGEWESERLPLGPAFTALGRRLVGARELSPASGARLGSLVVEDDGCAPVAIELDLAPREARLLQAALDRLRGLLARTGALGEVLDDDLDLLVASLARH
jgi:hypothetical protein